MMKILIVDDDNFKRENITNLLTRVSIDCDVSIEKALNPGLRRLFNDNFDIILLDMSLPTFDLAETENFDPFGGLAFLQEMKRRNIDTFTIIITQYEIFGEGSTQHTLNTIDEKCKNEFQNYVGLILYSSSDSAWKEKLVKMLGGLING